MIFSLPIFSVSSMILWSNNVFKILWTLGTLGRKLQRLWRSQLLNKVKNTFRINVKMKQRFCHYIPFNQVLRKLIFFSLVIIQNEPELLEEFGGNVKLNLSWAKSFLKRIDAKKMAPVVPIKDTTKVRQLSQKDD